MALPDHQSTPKKTFRVVKRGNPNHAHYHPNTKKPEKKTVKPSFNIHMMVKCKRCSKVFERQIDSQGHFLKLLADKGWKNVDFTKSEENENVYAKDIHGICCPGCVDDIKRWEEENHPPKKKSHLDKLEEQLVPPGTKVETMEFTEAVG
jgi:hypothetical protein